MKPQDVARAFRSGEEGTPSKGIIFRPSFLSRAKDLIENFQNLFLDQLRRDFRCCIISPLTCHASFALFYLSRDLNRDTGGSSAMERHFDRIVLSIGGCRRSADPNHQRNSCITLASLVPHFY